MNRTVIHCRLENLLRNEKVNLAKLKEELKKNKGGTLYIKERNGKIFFSEYVDGRQRGITKDRKRVYQLARREYLKELISAEERQHDKLECCIAEIEQNNSKNNLEKITDKFAMLNKEKIFLTAETAEWIAEAYDTNCYMTENLRYATTAGVKMRSKSERIIGNKLEEYGLPYRYEARIEIGGKSYYPDFTIRRESGEIILWEHFGLMSKEDYYFKSLQKIDLYRKIGYKQHSNLICTWEEDLEDVITIERILERFIL